MKKIPMDEVQAPTPNQIAKFLEIADNALEDNEAVAVHCRGGNGRTGTVGPLPDIPKTRDVFLAIILQTHFIRSHR